MFFCLIFNSVIIKINIIINNNMFKKIIFLVVVFFVFPIFVFARENVNYWYIKDFQTEIVLNTDSTAIITEYITADCGESSNKHGIFRILGTQINTGKNIIQMPIELISISDFYGKSHKYTIDNDVSSHTVTWKIGDSNKTVKGVNYYKIVYKVNNVIYNQDDFDELYFNILGNFWDMEIDNFNAKIILPQEINQKDIAIDYYMGPQGSKNKNLAIYSWTDENVLEFNSTKTIPKNNGITVSLSMPKNIFAPYSGILPKEDYSTKLIIGKTEFTHLNSINNIINIVLLIIALLFCFIIWKKYGDDPEDKRTIIAEYDIPDNLDPLLLGSLWKQGKLKNNFITAAIINFAVKKIIKIEEIDPEKELTESFKKMDKMINPIIGLLLKNVLKFAQNLSSNINAPVIGKNYVLHRLDNKESEGSLGPIEKELLFKIFGIEKFVTLSSLSNKFYKDVRVLQKNTKEKLIELGYIEKIGLKFQITFATIGSIAIFIGSEFAFYGLFLSGIVFFIYSFIMPKRTKRGIDLLRQIKGLKLYMEIAEKDRQRFYEKENIFEKLLPYAIVFGMTELWVNKVKMIYGEEQFNAMIPAWYIGSNFNFSSIDSFTNNFNNIVSSVSSAPHSSSGFGGGGFSGGGGGGGGGGGW